MRKGIKITLITFGCIFLLILTIAGVFLSIYATRLKTISSIEKISNYDDKYNLYKMNVKYDYDIENIINYGIKDDQSMIDAILKESLPILPVSIKAPSFGCTAFTLKTLDNNVHMGRNYDFKNDTSSMLVYCAPKNAYKSVAFAALDNIGSNIPDESLKKKLATLTAPFICLDGMNEKGVSIAVLTLDSEPVRQNTGKPVITTTLAIRLVLDKAANVDEAIELFKKYDMFASSERDYHFYITDQSGNGVVIEYDCEKKERPLVVTKMDAITNFYALYKEKVLPNQKNGIYGHGKERYNKVLKVFEENKENYTSATVWMALKEASQDKDPESITSNTQWSIAYNNTNLTVEIALRRHFDDVYYYDLKTNSIK